MNSNTRNLVSFSLSPKAEENKYKFKLFTSPNRFSVLAKHEDSYEIRFLPMLKIVILTTLSTKPPSSLHKKCEYHIFHFHLTFGVRIFSSSKFISKSTTSYLIVHTHSEYIIQSSFRLSNGERYQFSYLMQLNSIRPLLPYNNKNEKIIHILMVSKY